jgi:hypothetical protein
MMMLLSMLVAGSTLTGVPAPCADHTAIAAPARTLMAAAGEAARRESLTLTRNTQMNAAPQRRYVKSRRSGHHSVATRVTAIVAGSILGALGGVVGGAAIGAAGGEDGALAGMAYGIPIGAAAGGLLTAYYVK